MENPGHLATYDRRTRMDFVEINKSTDTKKKEVSYWPDFVYSRPDGTELQDIVIKGKEFYAFWDRNNHTWSKSQSRLFLLIDAETRKVEKESDPIPGYTSTWSSIRKDSSGRAKAFKNYVGNLETEVPDFDAKVLFKSDSAKRSDYSTTKLPYDLKDMKTPAFDELINVLYSPKELEKIMWFMGAALTPEMTKIEKFLFLYGGRGSGKGTVIDIFKKVYEGYWHNISLSDLTGGGPFATKDVKECPLLIDEDTDMSRIKKDTNLLKLTAHEPLNVNMKFAHEYYVTFHGLVLTASNRTYKVRDVNAGITRRAVVARPTNKTVDRTDYDRLIKQIDFEIPGIAYKAVKFFKEKGRKYYEDYVDTEMIEDTNIFHRFMVENEVALKDPMTNAELLPLYKLYLDELGYDSKYAAKDIYENLSKYYEKNATRKMIDGKRYRNVHEGLKRSLLHTGNADEVYLKDNSLSWLDLNAKKSIFDIEFKDSLAQVANKAGTPSVEWGKCKTTLKDIDTEKVHYMRPPKNLIILDFDLKDSEGNKKRELNLLAAQQYPPTYAEYSKSGQGLHLAYYWDGDPDELSNLIKENIEIKVFTGKQSLRRKMVGCNNLPIKHISSGLPLKKEEPVVYKDIDSFSWTDRKMRTSIVKALNRGYHDDTRSNIDMIKHVFEEAEKEGVEYDLSDLKKDVLTFAMRSTHQAPYCMNVVRHINYSTISADQNDLRNIPLDKKIYPNEELIFFDIEVYPNLLLVEWKRFGQDKVHKMFNPTREELIPLMHNPLVGFNNRRYDNHIIYNAYLGATNAELFAQSQEIISSHKGDGAGMMNNAWDLSYTDIYDYSSKKQSLKKWEVELGLVHDEAEFPWDQPLAKEHWNRIAEYCENDVRATEEVFKATQSDYEARCFLARLTGGSVSDSTNSLAAKFLFGDDPEPQKKFVYTDLSTIFPGYKFDKFESDTKKKSTYMGDYPSEGGYVYSEPGIYKDVAEIDVESMHPTSAIQLNYFGPYTKRYAELKQARLYIKHGDIENAGKMMNGLLKPYLGNPDDLPGLAKALKLVINGVYGMSSAKFPNKFKHPDNIDNIIAKRGALFMISLKHAVQDKGWRVVHIKTDAIKISDITDEKIKFVEDFGKKYGYSFAVEHVFDKFALLNKAVNVGHVEDNDKWGKESNTWEAIGAEFLQPFVYKTIFEPDTKMDIQDYFETKQVKNAMYFKDSEGKLIFIGKVGQFYASITGMELVRENKPDAEGNPRYGSVTGTKGVLWRSAEQLKNHDTPIEDVDMNHYLELVEDSIVHIKQLETEPGQASWFFPAKTSKNYKQILD